MTANALPENWATFADVQRGDLVERQAFGRLLRYRIVGKDAGRVALRPHALGALDEIWTLEGFEAARFALAEIKGSP